MSEMFTRRSLPHWFVPGAMHFVTYRLGGSIPKRLIQQWREERHEAIRRRQAQPSVKPDCRERAHKQFFANLDAHLDENTHRDWLIRPEVAAIIQENLHHHNGEKYHLLCYTIMPNHVHVVLQPKDGLLQRPSDWQHDEMPDNKSPLTKVMHSIKSYTANRINRALGREGQLWQTESYDHWVRDEKELERIVHYVNGNPVAAGLIEEPHLWPYGSAAERFALDGEKNGPLPIESEIEFPQWGRPT